MTGRWPLVLLFAVQSVALLWFSVENTRRFHLIIADMKVITALLDENDCLDWGHPEACQTERTAEIAAFEAWDKAK